ncbi:MAG: hypothetical protein CVU62_02345 [Deltaproteobacteria bacterium HGW-Deltaproteobacteria-2]|nr:MAG: hypothetical protein CVU62_02345 [Deltaproteobacteria bacterium HGW-Deltaproteobacteria-2]
MDKKRKRFSFPPKEYGAFLAHLVNAETTLAAYLVLFDNICKLFKTDDLFLYEVNEIKKLYDDFLSEFNDTERRAVALKMREAEALLVLHEAPDLIQDTIIERSSSEEDSKETKRKYLKFKDFDDSRKALVFTLAPQYLDWSEDILPKPDEVSIDFSDKRLNPLYQFEYKELRNVHDEIEKIKKQITDDRFRYISQKTMDELNYLIDRNGDMGILRGFLRHFLEELTHSNELIEISLIHTILQSYNECRHDYYLDDQDDIIKMQLPFEEYEFGEWAEGYGSDNFIGSWEMKSVGHWYRGNSFQFMFEWDNLIFRVCCFSAMQFINKKEDRKRLKKCPYCNLFFIAKDNKRQRCYEESCAREYEKEKKRKQREDDPVTYL